MSRNSGYKVDLQLALEQDLRQLDQQRVVEATLGEGSSSVRVVGYDQPTAVGQGEQRCRRPDAVTAADLARLLLGVAAQQFDQLAEDMRNYAIKRDAIRSGLLNDDEKQSHIRALAHLAGHKLLWGPWPTDTSI